MQCQKVVYSAIGQLIHQAYIFYFQKIQLFAQLIVLQHGQLNERFRNQIVQNINVIFNQVFVQKIIYNMLQDFGKTWDHRYWSIVTYVTTVLTLVNRSKPSYIYAVVHSLKVVLFPQKNMICLQGIRMGQKHLEFYWPGFSLFL